MRCVENRERMLFGQRDGLLEDEISFSKDRHTKMNPPCADPDIAVNYLLKQHTTPDQKSVKINAKPEESATKNRTPFCVGPH